MQAGPLAQHITRRFESGALFSGERQSKLHSAQAQANGPALECAVGLVPATNTGKGTQLAPAYGQHVHADLAGRLGHRPISRDHRITQGDLLRALLQRQVALDRKEAKYIERQVAAGLEQVAFGAVDVKLQGLATRLQVEGVAGRKVGNLLTQRSGVESHGQTVCRQRQTVNAGKRQMVGIGGHGLPGLQAITGIRKNAHREIKTGGIEADKFRLASIDPDLCREG